MRIEHCIRKYLPAACPVHNRMVCPRSRIRVYIQKFPDWPSGARTANDTTLPLDAVVSHEFCCHLRCSSSVYFCTRIFHYRLSPENSGYTIVLHQVPVYANNFNFIGPDNVNTTKNIVQILLHTNKGIYLEVNVDKTKYETEVSK